MNEEKSVMNGYALLLLACMLVCLIHGLVRPNYGLLRWIAIFPGGIYLWGVGTFLNKLVRKFNEGKMPTVVKVDIDSLNEEESGNLLANEDKMILRQNLDEDDKHYCDRRDNIHLSFLANQIEWGGKAFSLGDLLMLIGLTWFVIQNSLLLILYSTPL